MKLFTRRQYRTWLFATLEKKTLTREEIEKILRGQLLLPVKRRDMSLMKECAAALDEMEGAAHPQKAATWSRIAAGVSQMEAFPRPFVKRRVVLILVVLAVLALAALGVAAALSPGVFSFLWGQHDPNSYVQENAAGLLKTDLPSISREHVEIIIREAAYDGKELRVVYSVRDKNATRLYTTSTWDDVTLLSEAARLDGLGAICDWVMVNGQDPDLSEAGTLTGDRPGELLFYIQSLLADQDIHPKGDFTVGLPLEWGTDPSTGRYRPYVPPELTFTLNAEEAMRLLRTATPAETTVEGIRIEITEATFSPVTGALYLRLTGPDKDKLENSVSLWWGQAQLFTREGVQMGICSPEYMDSNNWQEGILLKIDVVPPEAWPEEMIFSIPDENGKPDPARQIPVKLQ